MTQAAIPEMLYNGLSTIGNTKMIWHIKSNRILKNLLSHKNFNVGRFEKYETVLFEKSNNT